MSGWPVLTSYDRDHLLRVALPLGGLGTGTVALGGRGDLRDWEVGNRPAKGFAPRVGFFALWARPAGGAAVTRALEAALDPVQFEGAFGCGAPTAGLPRFRHGSFEACYPFGRALLSDPDVPLTVAVEGFNPLIPADSDASGIPVAVLRYRLGNPGDVAVDAAVCGSLENFIGRDGSSEVQSLNVNTRRDEGRVAGLLLASSSLAPDADLFGTLALAVVDGDGVTHRTAWTPQHWGDPLLDFWDDFGADGALDDVSHPRRSPVASLAARVHVPAGETREVTFLLTWHFPNRVTWTPRNPRVPEDTIGNYYTTRWPDAWAVAVDVATRLPELEARSQAFANAVAESDLPHVVKEAALYNLTALRSQVSFRTPDGKLFGWEGTGDRAGCCHGTCTHVWNYEVATAFLFGDLARGQRHTEFAHTTDADGLMHFRVNLPLSRAREFNLAAADGQMGCLLKLYREWQLSGDDAFLRELWPHARRALEFCWLPGGWDADQDGVMEGCQHNTMDVEYYGPNGQMGAWYLGALRAGEELARHLGETDFAARCHDLYTRGRAWMAAELFNGEYYEQDVRPASGEVRAGLRSQMGAIDPSQPDYQLGAACLVDQLVGQYLAHVCGLGHLLDPDQVATTLRSIKRHNFRRGFYGHFNHMRSYVLNDESALLMATYPRGERPKFPFPYFNEVMTGFEYAAAIGMLYEGLVEDGLECLEAIRARYDGRRRSPFDEAECGHHYARAMASWAAIPALTGFQWSGVTRTMRFAEATQHVKWCWSTGDAWGTFEQWPVEPDSLFREVDLRVLGGTLTIEHLLIGDRREAQPCEGRPGRWVA